MVDRHLWPRAPSMHLIDIPGEVISNVLYFLAVRDLLALELVCPSLAITPFHPLIAF